MRTIFCSFVLIWTLTLPVNKNLRAEASTCIPFEYEGRRGDWCRLNGESIFILPKHWMVSVPERVRQNESQALKVWDDLNRMNDSEPGIKSGVMS